MLKIHISLILTIGLNFYVSCQQIPYREIIKYDDPTGTCNYILFDGFDKTCIVHEEKLIEVPIEVIVEKIVEVVVIEKEIIEVPVIVEKVRERIVEVPVEVPVEVFVTEIVEVIKEVYIEIPVEVPIPEIVREVKTVYVERNNNETPTIVENKIYDSTEYLNWVKNGKPNGKHQHTFWHSHDGKRHGHRFVHPNGQEDNWEREHAGFSGLTHE